MTVEIKLGCDPELFMADITGKLRASCGLIGGSKMHPLPLPIGDGYAVQEDNVAIEFNTPPASSAKEFVASVKKAMTFLGDVVREQHGFTIVNVSAASFPKDELEHPAAQEFGCDPDFNAWTMRKNPRPKADDASLRSCGGHVHVGFKPGALDGPKLIRAMDLYLGVPSVLMDKGELRKQLYGKAGAFRKKSYGMEYRTLSNFWVFDDRLTQWVWENTERAVQAVDSQFAIDDYRDSILDAINNNNKDAARFLAQECKLEVLNV
jgi:hypothetical protein